MKDTIARLSVVVAVVALALVGGCRTAAAPPIRFAPSGTDAVKLRSDFPLTSAERAALTPEAMRLFSQDQIDQIYVRLNTGPMPDGPFRGDLFFPRDRDRHVVVHDMPGTLPGPLADIGTVPIEQLGKVLWRGKVFFRDQGILRNRIEELLILAPFIKHPETIPKLTFDGQTTWLLFPAKVSCGQSRFHPANHSVVIDYSKGSEVEGYRDVPDKLAGPEGLDIRDEVRRVRAGFYLGRAYFHNEFGLNFTLLDPAQAPVTPGGSDDLQDCGTASP
jgi:hypothetical protein